MVIIGLSRKYVFRRPSQNLAVLLGIFLGVSLFIGIQVGSDTLAQGFGAVAKHNLGSKDAAITNRVTNFFVDNNTYTNILPSGKNTYAQNYLNELRSNSTVNQYVGSLSQRLQFSVTVVNDLLGTIEISEPFVGIPKNETGFGDLTNKNNQILKISDLKPGEVYIGRSLANLLFAKNDKIIGQNLTISGSFNSLAVPFGKFPIPSSLISYNKSILVKGVFEDNGKGKEQLSRFIAAPLSWVQQVMKDALQSKRAKSVLPVIGYGVNPINQIIVHWKADVNTNDKRTMAFNATRDAFKLIIGPQFSQFYQYSNSIVVIDSFVKLIADSLTLLLNVFGSLIAFAAVLVIVNIQSLALQSREKETGIVRAIGASRFQITMTNLTESLFLGIIGSAFGILGGAAYGQILILILSYSFGISLTDLSLVITTQIIINSFIAGIVLSQITGLIPAINASRVNIAEVLRGIKPPSSEKFGKKSLYLGAILTVLAIFQNLLYQDSVFYKGQEAFTNFTTSETNYLNILTLIVGPSLLLAYYRSKKLGLTLASAGLVFWAYFNIFVVFDWIKTGSGGLNYILYLMFSLIVGTIALIGTNLDFIANVGEWLFNLFARTKKTPIRGTSMVAFRQMRSKKVRSTLTFALFATILTLNIFLGTFSYSFRYGFDNVILTATSGSDVMLLTGQPIPNSVNYSKQLTDHFQTPGNNSGLKLNFVKGFTYSNPTTGYLQKNGSLKRGGTLLTVNSNSLWDSKGSWILKFNLLDNKTGTPFETGKNIQGQPSANKEDEAVWKALSNNTYIPNKNGTLRPIILLNTLVSFQGGQVKQLKRPGDSVWLNLTTGGLQEFVVGSILGENPLNSQSQGGGPPGAGSGIWFVSDQWTQNLTAYSGLTTSQNVFLGQSNAGDVRSKSIDRLITDIEIFSNKNGSAFRTKYGLFGVYGFSVYSIFEAQLEGQFRFFGFLQAFTSMGFVVGILGLFVVAYRSVAERKREIGMLRALGFRRRDVLYAVMLELIVTGLIGLVIGIINGIVLAYGIIRSGSGSAGTSVQLLIPIDILTIYIAITLGSALLAAVLPGLFGSRIPPSDALRYTG